MTPARPVALTLVLFLASLALPPSRAVASPGAGPDSLRFQLEIGATTDYTNELFYEDTFDGTVFTGRRLVDSPETRFGGVITTRLAGTRGSRTTGFELSNDLRLGDLIQRGALGLVWRSTPSPVWRYQVMPRIEYRHDRSFDRDLEEWRGSVGTRVRRELDEGSTVAEAGARGDFIRSSGRGSQYILDRHSGTVTLALDRIPLWGPQWRFGFGFTTRLFPDSSERNHFEHGWEGNLRFDLPGGRPLILEGVANRRVTIDVAPTSRDNFWEERGLVDAEIGLAGPWSLRARAEGEAIQYDLEDTTLFFNYQILRGRVGPRLTLGKLSLTGGPRAEALFSRLDPGEGYQEIAGALEIEFFSRGSWWSVTPAAGWRDYDELPAGTPDGFGLHSSYAFYEVGLLADQSLPGGLRLRAFANVRFEVHIDRAQDARSLYFSVDLRRLF